ncbi:MAG: ArsR family transcriptional regulator [Candidatus Thorarchaeota archaeon]|nr:ArsR family transcriptional regulator [Candidatus Thorarchaeota archaeon]
MPSNIAVTSSHLMTLGWTVISKCTPQSLKGKCYSSKSMQSIDSKIIELWRSCSRILDERFGLNPPDIPQTIDMTSALQVYRFGGHYDPESMVFALDGDSISNGLSLLGIVYRECLFNALPTILCEELRHDLSLQFALYNIEKKEKGRWTSEWNSLPNRRIRSNLVYGSYRMMNWIHTLGGEKQLDSLLHEFVCMAKYGKPVDFIDYVEYMMRRTQEIEVGFSHAEAKILDTLLKNENASYREVAKITGFSESWVSTRINRLKNKYVLTGLTITPFSKIGIRTFHVLLSAPSWSNPTHFLTDCPFLYSIQPVLSGPWQVLARLAIPDTVENIQSLNRMESTLHENGIAVDIAETYSAGISNSFYHYKVTNHRWEIPWVAMEGWGHRIKKESLDKVVECIDFPSKTTDTYLDPIDMQILGLIHRGNSSTRTIRKSLSIGQNNLIKRIKRLTSAELIQKRWSVYNLGLVERVSLRTTDKRTASILDAWVRDLPRTYLHYGPKRKLFMITELPAGGSTKLMSVLHNLRWPVIVSPLGSSVWGHWTFPDSLWCVETQSWQTPKKEIEIWLDKLTVSSELLAQNQNFS